MDCYCDGNLFFFPDASKDCFGSKEVVIRNPLTYFSVELQSLKPQDKVHPS